MRYVNRILKYTLLIMIMIIGESCQFEEQIDPNGPSLSGVISNASIAQLNNLVTGTISTMRNPLGASRTASGSMAREMYLFDADPRNTTDVLGKNGTTLDNNTFYTTAPFAGHYLAVKNANVLLQSLANSIAPTAEERAGYEGFAKTIIAHELIEIVKLYDKARIDVSDPDNLGPILNKADALDEIISMLDDAETDLNAAGAEFAFPLSSGFDGFDTPATFLEFNRAVAARANLYAGNFTTVLTNLTASFFDLNGDLTIGPKYVFSLAGGDQTNGMFKTPGQNGDQIIVHNSFIADAEAGDTRVTAKTALRVDATSQDGLNGTHETRLYASNTSSIDIIRNEELILIYAEANIQIGGANLADAVIALDIIRDAADLDPYVGSVDQPSLTTEMLNQRRYSLWAEGHRMFDLRRYNLSNTLPIDRAGDVVYNVLPIPLTENE